MDPLVFFFHGDPRGKGRPRLSTRGGFARAFTDPKTRQYEQSIAREAALVLGSRKPLEGPLSVSVQLRLQVPASMSKRQRARVLAGEEAYLGRIDVDNGAKAVLDAMNGVVWADDKQIVRLWITKEPHEKPGVTVIVRALEPQDEQVAEPALPSRATFRLENGAAA